MKEYLLLFRQSNYEEYQKASKEKMEAIAKKWKDWGEKIVSQGKLVSYGPRLAMEGKVLKNGGAISNAPFVELREILGSFMTIKAENLDDATTLAHGCPAIEEGGSVEIRPIYG